MATYVKGDAVANATAYELYEKTDEGYELLAEAEEINFEVSALGLTAGVHTLTVKAVADGYEDSEYSNEVAYTAVDSYTDITSDISFTHSQQYRFCDSAGSSWSAFLAQAPNTTISQSAASFYRIAAIDVSGYQGKNIKVMVPTFKNSSGLWGTCMSFFGTDSAPLALSHDNRGTYWIGAIQDSSWDDLATPSYEEYEWNTVVPTTATTLYITVYKPYDGTISGNTSDAAQSVIDITDWVVKVEV